MAPFSAFGSVARHDSILSGLAPQPQEGSSILYKAMLGPSKRLVEVSAGSGSVLEPRSLAKRVPPSLASKAATVAASVLGFALMVVASYFLFRYVKRRRAKGARQRSYVVYGGQRIDIDPLGGPSSSRKEFNRMVDSSSRYPISRPWTAVQNIIHKHKPSDPKWDFDALEAKRERDTLPVPPWVKTKAFKATYQEPHIMQTSPIAFRTSFLARPSILISDSRPLGVSSRISPTKEKDTRHLTFATEATLRQSTATNTSETTLTSDEVDSPLTSINARTRNVLRVVQNSSGPKSARQREFNVPDPTISVPNTPRLQSLSSFIINDTAVLSPPVPWSARVTTFPPTPPGFDMTSRLTLTPATSTSQLLSSAHQRTLAESQTESSPDLTTVPRLVRVVGTFQPTLQDELLLNVGDTMRLLQIFPDDWCLVQRIRFATEDADSEKYSSREKCDAREELESGAVPILCLTEMSGKPISRAPSSRVAEEILSPGSVSGNVAQSLPSVKASSKASGSDDTDITGSSSGTVNSSIERSHWSPATTNAGLTASDLRSPITPASTASVGSSAAAASNNGKGNDLLLPPVPASPTLSSQSLEIPRHVQNGYAFDGHAFVNTSFVLNAADKQKKHESSGYAITRAALHKAYGSKPGAVNVKVSRSHTMRPPMLSKASFSSIIDRARNA